jgi:hypothetical protein
VSQTISSGNDMTCANLIRRFQGGLQSGCGNDEKIVDIAAPDHLMGNERIFIRHDRQQQKHDGTR